MSALIAMTRWNARLQYRYGIFAAAAFVTIVWAIVLRMLPDASMPSLLPGILIGDTAVFGFFLLTGMLFLERDDRVLDALGVVPLGPGRDLIARVIPLTVVSVLVGIGITLVAHGHQVNWIALTLGLGLAAPMHMLAGVAYASRFRKITDYIFPAALILMIAGISLLHFYGVWTPIWMWAMPTMPPITLLRGMFEPLSNTEWVYGIVGSIVWTVLAFLWARGEVHRFARRREKKGRLGAMLAPSHAVPSKAVPLKAAPPKLADAGMPTASSASSSSARGIMSLALTDLRNLGREPLMAFIAIYAILLAFVVRWAVPVLHRTLEGTFDLTPYHPLIASSFAVAATPIMMGAVVGLLLLDEHDEGSLKALRVTPLPTTHYAIYRAAVPTIVSAVFTFFVIWIVGLVVPPSLDLLPVAILSALEAPIAMLVLAGFASNKVEGLALMKGLGFFLLGPIVAWFIAPPWRWVVGILPTYWPTEAFWRISGATGVGGAADASVWPVLLIGFVYHIGLIWWLARRFVRRI